VWNALLRALIPVFARVQVDEWVAERGLVLPEECQWSGEWRPLERGGWYLADVKAVPVPGYRVDAEMARRYFT
jgi:hypothetical protein